MNYKEWIESQKTYDWLKKILDEEDFKEIYGDWKPEVNKQLKLFESSELNQGF